MNDAFAWAAPRAGSASRRRERARSSPAGTSAGGGAPARPRPDLATRGARRRSRGRRRRAALPGRGPATMLTETLARTGARSVESLIEGAARVRIDASSFAPQVVPPRPATRPRAPCWSGPGRSARRPRTSSGGSAWRRRRSTWCSQGLSGRTTPTRARDAVAGVAPGVVPVILDAPPVVGSWLRRWSRAHGGGGDTDLVVDVVRRTVVGPTRAPSHRSPGAARCAMRVQPSRRSA
jgi:hypothetical protein